MSPTERGVYAVAIAATLFFTIYSIVSVEPLVTSVLLIIYSVLWRSVYKAGKLRNAEPRGISSLIFRLTPIYYITLALTLFLFWLPTIITFEALSSGGAREYGFPLVYSSYQEGCVAWWNDQRYDAKCPPIFDVSAYYIDILFLIGLPLLVNTLVLTWKKKRNVWKLLTISIIPSLLWQLYFSIVPITDTRVADGAAEFGWPFIYKTEACGFFIDYAGCGTTSYSYPNLIFNFFTIYLTCSLLIYIFYTLFHRVKIIVGTIHTR